MPAYFVVDLSPPRSNQGLSPDMSPSTYLRDPNMLSFLRRAIPFEIGPEIMRCTLDPPPAEIDRTIKQYHKRVYEACSKAEISVLMPVVGNALKEVSRYFKIWEAKLVMSLVSYISLQYRLTGLGIRGNSSRPRCRTKQDFWQNSCQARTSKRRQRDSNRRTQNGHGKTSHLAHIHDATNRSANKDVQSNHSS